MLCAIVFMIEIMVAIRAESPELQSRLTCSNITGLVAVNVDTSYVLNPNKDPEFLVKPAGDAVGVLNIFWMRVWQFGSKLIIHHVRDLLLFHDLRNGRTARAQWDAKKLFGHVSYINHVFMYHNKLMLFHMEPRRSIITFFVFNETNITPVYPYGQQMGEVANMKGPWVSVMNDRICLIGGGAMEDRSPLCLNPRTEIWEIYDQLSISAVTFKSIVRDGILHVCCSKVKSTGRRIVPCGYEHHSDCKSYDITTGILLRIDRLEHYIPSFKLFVFDGEVQTIGSTSSYNSSGSCIRRCRAGNCYDLQCGGGQLLVAGVILPCSVDTSSNTSSAIMTSTTTTDVVQSDLRTADTTKMTEDKSPALTASLVGLLCISFFVLGCVILRKRIEKERIAKKAKRFRKVETQAVRSTTMSEQ